jgi:dihydrofolate synthase/folylpolyglutamate synthase
MSEYESAVAWLEAHIGAGIKPGLDRIAGLMDILGNPQVGYPTMHVAGTNGKTSVVRMISSILTAHGLKVGSTVSPHLRTVNERLQVDLEPASDEMFVEAVNDLRPFADIYASNEQSPSYFELTTALALSYFASSAVDAAVVEVGLGGRWDATNILEGAVSVVTSISLDHTELLGDTIGEIAAEKLAIAKEGSVLVTGPLPEEAGKVARALVEERNLIHYEYSRDFSVAEAVISHGGWAVDVEGIFGRYEDLYLPVHGRHQTENLACAIAAVEGMLGRSLSIEALREGVETLHLPGRLEIIDRQPVVVVDGAHNPAAFSVLQEALRSEFSTPSWTLVIGSMGDKEIPTMIAELADLVDNVVVTSVDSPRAMDPTTLAGLVQDILELEPEVVVDPTQALGRAKELAGSDGAVIVTGSLYLVGEILTNHEESDGFRN